MPIDKTKYVRNWKELSKSLKEAVGYKCELCGISNGSINTKTGSKVVLTVHHIDKNTMNNDLCNLIVLCQKCHLRLHRCDRQKNHQVDQKQKLF